MRKVIFESQSCVTTSQAIEQKTSSTKSENDAKQATQTMFKEWPNKKQIWSDHHLIMSNQNLDEIKTKWDKYSSRILLESPITFQRNFIDQT